MSNEASVAPKERVNIVYRPAEGDGREEVELPMKLLVLGDFTGSSDQRPMEKRQPVSINKENFDEVMRGQDISLQLEVPNCLTGNPEQELGLNLKFQRLKDFGPEAVIEQVPQLKRILELREALRALKGPLANVPEFRRKLQELIGNDATRTKLLTELGQRED
jgi:type VI secretion system protein ImpB